MTKGYYQVTWTDALKVCLVAAVTFLMHRKGNYLNGEKPETVSMASDRRLESKSHKSMLLCSGLPSRSRKKGIELSAR